MIRQFFNAMWKGQIKRLMEGKAQILELVEQAITTYHLREEWCAKLDALKEKAAMDYRKHCLVSWYDQISQTIFLWRRTHYHYFSANISRCTITIFYDMSIIRLSNDKIIMKIVSITDYVIRYLHTF